MIKWIQMERLVRVALRTVGIKRIVGIGYRQQSTRTFEQIAGVVFGTMGICTRIALSLEAHEDSGTQSSIRLVVFKEVRPIDRRLMREEEHQIFEAHNGCYGKDTWLVWYSSHVMGGLLLPRLRLWGCAQG